MTRREAALCQLRNEIVTGQLAPGTIVKDAELAARLGISITPVREAIAQLAAEGLIDVAPNRARRVTHVTRQSSLELLDVAGLLACAGFEWAMDNLTAEDLRRLRTAYDEMAERTEAGDLAGAGTKGSEFHSIIIDAAGNRELKTHLDLVVSRVHRVQSFTAECALWWPWFVGCGEILELLEREDRAGALERYRQLCRDYRTHLAETVFRTERAEAARTPVG